MSIAIPPSLVSPFGFNADPTTIVDTPYDSQSGVLVGAASYEDGFPLATMVDPESKGGVPAYGQDMNGILYAATAHVAWIAAGQQYVFNPNIVAKHVGYPVGSIIVSAVTPDLFFYSFINNNANNPDIDATGWVPFRPLSNPTDQLIDVPVAPGTFDNVAVGFNVGFLDIDTTAGNMTYTGFSAGNDGQSLIVTNVGVNLLTLAALTGSAANNQLRLPTDLSFTHNDGIALRYSQQIGKWVKA